MHHLARCGPALAGEVAPVQSSVPPQRLPPRSLLLPWTQTKGTDKGLVWAQLIILKANVGSPPSGPDKDQLTQG
ncbi:hypothetical protein EYF80_030144 [Liparis tanakae]|uniref:Uncharacterized protein n=1 Tax=Liparis tanakae TaxID=230148 RepID=A0A4Z2H1C6_9TELE|nr:hypothetical protein EYF80_030144 [Liparis tanakae]